MVLSEKERLHRLRAGVYSEFCFIHEKYAPMLYNFVFDLCRSKMQAEEIVQDVFIKIWLNRSRIDPDRSFKSLIFTIARNRFIDIFRQRMRDPLFGDYIGFTESLDLPDEPVIDRVYDFEDFNRRLSEAKAALTPRQREIFELNKEQGYSAAEIAAQLGLSEAVVYNQISAALKKLRDSMLVYGPLFVIFFM